MKNIPLVYVAGAYSAPTLAERLANIGRARAVARMVGEAGAYPRVPHLVGEICDDLHDWEWWMAATSRDLDGCEGAVFIPGWEASRGSVIERQQCIDHEIAIFELPSLSSPLGDVVGHWFMNNGVAELSFARWVARFGRAE